MPKSTEELLNILSKEKDPEQFIQKNKEEFDDVPLYKGLLQLLKKYKVSKSSVITKSALDRTYAYQIFNGTKTNPSRNKLLSICLSIGADLAETQRILRIGHAEQLHPRNIRDSIIIHSIQHRVSKDETDEILFSLNQELLCEKI